MINRSKIDFLCIGAQKSGTTTLHDILAQNPSVVLPRLKETHFFSHDELYTSNIEDYFRMFEDKRVYEDHLIKGEIDPEYLCSEKAAHRIKKAFGNNLKFIIIVRNPSKRAFSQYLMSKRRGFEDMEFLSALDHEEDRTKDDFGFRYFSYGSRSKYVPQIEKYIELFGKASILCLRFEEDFIKNKKNSIDRIHSFLELEPFNYDLDISSNKASEPKSKLIRDFVNKPNVIRKIGKGLIPSARLRRSLISSLDELNKREANYSSDPELHKELNNTLFKDDIDQLEDLMELDLSSWRR